MADRESPGPPRLVRGSVVTHRRRCGKPNCRCADGQALHETTVLSWVRKGEEQGSGKYHQLLKAYRAALARRAMNAKMQIIAHAKKNFVAADRALQLADPTTVPQVRVHVPQLGQVVKVVQDRNLRCRLAHAFEHLLGKDVVENVDLHRVIPVSGSSTGDDVAAAADCTREPAPSGDSQPARVSREHERLE